jgi:hypothetical protein
MMAAISAASSASRRVVVLERLPRPGAKLLASGGGRANITNTLALQRSFGSRLFTQPSDGSLQDTLSIKELRHGCQTDSAVEAEVECVSETI